MSFGKKSASHSTAPLEAYVVKQSLGDAALVVFGMALCCWQIWHAANGAWATFDLPLRLVTIGAGMMIPLFLLALTMTGKTKLKVDETGFYQYTVRGDRHISWSEMKGFEVISVKYSQIVSLTAWPAIGSTKSQKMGLPLSVFRSRDLELVKWMARHRPDMVPAVVDVMKKVGAKRLAKKVMSGEAGAMA